VDSKQASAAESASRCTQGALPCLAWPPSPPPPLVLPGRPAAIGQQPGPRQHGQGGPRAGDAQQVGHRVGCCVSVCMRAAVGTSPPASCGHGNAKRASSVAPSGGESAGYKLASRRPSAGSELAGGWAACIPLDTACYWTHRTCTTISASDPASQPARQASAGCSRRAAAMLLPTHPCPPPPPNLRPAPQGGREEEQGR
jgi:hypothetical protein